MGDPEVSSIPGAPNLLLGAYDVATLGYDMAECFVSGSATSYAPTAPLGFDGQWSVAASSSADYTTRIAALTPADESAFNGTVIVEWLNVSGGIDAPAFWSSSRASWWPPIGTRSWRGRRPAIRGTEPP
jgi:hypothetical protein